jgi:hypothetical protein
LSHVLNEGKKSHRIDVVFDVYKKMSIKDLERAIRGADTGTHFKKIAVGHKITQWRKLLASASSQKILIEFLVNEWKKPKQRERLEDKVMYVTCNQICYKITQEMWEEDTELKFTQKEAVCCMNCSTHFMQQNMAANL